MANGKTSDRVRNIKDIINIPISNGGKVFILALYFPEFNWCPGNFDQNQFLLYESAMAHYPDKTPNASWYGFLVCQ